jgi:hypothetical protein
VAARYDGSGGPVGAVVAVSTPPDGSRAAVFAAMGGALGGAVTTAVLAGGAVIMDRAPAAGPNAVGAWLVRWLQTAAPDALDGFYADATLGGLAVAVVAGAVTGAVFGAFLDRLPHDRPLVWGLLLGLLLWALAHHVVAPALDPLLVRLFDWRVLLPAFVAYGAVVGLWVQGGRGLDIRSVHAAP